MTDRRFEIVKIILDKCLIGLLIVIAGLWGNKLVEEYKSAEGFRRDMSRIQATKISEVWEAIYSFEDAYDRMITKVMPLYDEARAENDGSTPDFDKLGRSIQTSFPVIIQTAEERHSTVMALAMNHRFWLGEARYLAVSKYIDLMQAYRVEIEGSDVDQQSRLKRELDLARRGIRQTRDELLNDQ